MSRSAPKPWYRLRNLCLVAFALAFCLAGYIVLRGVTAVASRRTDYAQKLFDLAKAQQPANATPGDNAWPELQEIARLQSSLQREVIVSQLDEESSRGVYFDYLYALPDASKTQAEREADEAPERIAEKALDTQIAQRALELMTERGVFQRLDALRPIRAAYRPKLDELLILRLLPELGTARSLARASAAQFRFALSRGDEDEAVRSIERALALGRICAHQDTLIERLVATAIDALVFHEIHSQIAAGKLSASASRRILKAVDEQVIFPPLTNTLEFERLGVLDLIEATHTDNGHGDGIIVLNAVDRLNLKLMNSTQGPLTGSSLKNSLWFLMPGKAETVAKTNFFYDSSIKIAQMPRRANRDAVFMPDIYVETKLTQRDALLRMVLPAIGSMIGSNDQFMLRLGGLRATLAIELFRDKHARLPKSLDELVPEFLASLPDDPYAADGKLRYKVLPGPDSFGRMHLLYSVGADGKDDAGAPHPTQRLQALQRRQDNPPCDFILNAIH